jgi:hypothetical protein
MPTKNLHPVDAKKAATLAAGHDKPRSNAAPKKATAAAKKPSQRKDRLTNAWTDSKGRDVPVKATVSWDGKQWTVRGRFTMKPKTGELVPALGLVPKSGKGKGRHTPAKAVTLVK